MRRRNIIVGLLATVIVLVYVLCGVLLWRGAVALWAVKGQLDSSKGELEMLFAHDPFPSEQNLADERQNLSVLQGEFGRLLASLSEGQVEPVEQGPPKFIAQFWETQKDLLAKAKDAGITVPKDFPFGFARHMPGALPAPQDVPRLTQQLRIVQNLCGMLYASHISELRGFGREEFETGVSSGPIVPEEPAAPRVRGRRVEAGPSSLNMVRPDAGQIAPGELYGRWHFVTQFAAKENALIEVLNQLAKSKMFVVVTRLEVTGEDKPFARAAEKAAAENKPEAGATTNAPAEPPARELRIACGRDASVSVKLELDVYQFGKVPASEPAKEPKS
jgi:hypothetical protein